MCLTSFGTLILSVTVGIPGSAHCVMFCFVFAGASFASKQTTGLVNNAGQSFQRFQGSINSVGHVGTKEKKNVKDVRQRFCMALIFVQ